MDERTVHFARELERRDSALADEIARVAELQRDVEALRDRAAAAQDALAHAPHQEASAADALQRAREQLDGARQDAERARRERVDAERAGGDDRLAAAERAEQRALDALRRAEGRLARAEADVADARSIADRARAEADELDRRARAVALAVADVPRLSAEGAGEPASGLEGVLAWASRVRAALWVVRSGRETERERVVREANELATSALGEPLVATSVASVRARLERQG